MQVVDLIKLIHLTRRFIDYIVMVEPKWGVIRIFVICDMQAEIVADIRDITVDSLSKLDVGF